MVPEWMEDKNGFWTSTSNTLIDITYQFLQAWMEDNEPKDVYETMEKYKTLYTMETMKTELSKVYDEIVLERINEFKVTLPKEETVDNQA
jgi:uncharacterized protein YqgQ